MVGKGEWQVASGEWRVASGVIKGDNLKVASDTCIIQFNAVK